MMEVRDRYLLVVSTYLLCIIVQVKPLRLASLNGESTLGGTVVPICKETILCIIVLVRDSGKLANLLTESTQIMPNFQIEAECPIGAVHPAVRVWVSKLAEG